LQSEFEDPFENLRRSNQLTATKDKENGMANVQIEDWLPE